MTNNYPSADEVKRIVAQRKEMEQEFIASLLLTDEREQTRKFKQLIARYGQAEMDRAMAVYRQRLQPRDPDDENAMFHRAYVDYYRRFGGQRPLLTPAEYAVANDEFAPLIIRHQLGHPLTVAEQERLAYLSDLMLKDAPFWEDIMPEDPPAIMPPLNLPPPPPRKTAPRPAAGHSVSRYPLCPNDGFPMITINGRLECCLEALNRCLGHKKVVEVTQRGKTTYYTFEDGHELPVLCGCCGQGMVSGDLADERKEMCGRRLEGAYISDPMTKPNQPEFNELVLEFSKPGIFSRPTYVSVAFEAVAQIRHPGATPPVKPASGKNRSQSKGHSGKKKSRKK